MKSPLPVKRSTTSGGGRADAPASPWTDKHKGVGTSSGNEFSTKTTPVAGISSVNIDGLASGKRHCNVRAPAVSFRHQLRPQLVILQAHPLLALAWIDWP